MSIRSFISFTGLASFLILSSYEIAVATTLNGGSVADLGHSSVWIGRLEIQEISTIPSSADFPFSKVKAKVLEIFKGSGSSGQSVSFEIPGGQRGRNSFVVMGFPSFKVGGEYVLFLDSDPTASATALSMGSAATGLVGWSAFRILDSGNKQVSSKVVVRAGEPSLLQNSGNGMALSHDRSIKTYDDFVSEIFRSLD